MKLKVITVITILSAAILILVVYSLRNDSEFTVLATSYSESSTSLYNYNNEKLVETDTYQIGGVENIRYDDKGYGIMYDKYGDQLVIINDKKVINYKVNNNPAQLQKTEKGQQFILHNENLEFSISKYNETYDKLLQSEALPGYAQNFIILNDIIYVLTNIYDENSNRTVGIYSLDINSLKVLDIVEVPGLTFAFYIREDNSDLKIYGNTNEAAKDLAIYNYELGNNKINLEVNSDISVMRIRKVFDINKKEIIFNDYSIVSLDEENNPKVEFANNQTLIDLEYSETEESYYLLSGNYETNKFEVHKLDKNFDIIEISSLSIDGKKPTDLLLK